MQDDKWYDLIEDIKQKFEILSQEEEPIYAEQNDGTDLEIGKKEIITLKNPMGKMQIIRTTTPLVIGRDEKYHKHSGVGVTKLIYSPTEKVHKIEAFVWDTMKEEWKKIDTKGTFSV